MKIAVLGSGVIGITTAYFLAKSGHKIILIDKNSGAGQECSFSNGAQLSYCSAQPWANRGALLKAIKWIGKTDAPLRFRFQKDINMWLWLMGFIANCTPKKEHENTKGILDLCLYSRDVLHRYEADFDFNFDYTKGGKIFVFEDKESHAGYIKQCQFQEVLGAPYQVLNKEDLFNYEPSLKHYGDNIYGAVCNPLDEAGDTYKFCQGLDKKLDELGAEKYYNTIITDFKLHNNKIKSVFTDKGEIGADLFVFSVGANSPLLSKKLGIKLPMYPLKGYSITTDIKNAEQSPNNSITFSKDRTVFSVLGDKLRVAGTAEFAGYNTSVDKGRIDMLKNLCKKVYPNVGDIDSSAEWACLRPCTADGSPILGETKIDNLMLNTGQGSLGWTMAFSSAQIVTDIINGKQPEIDSTPYSIERY